MADLAPNMIHLGTTNPKIVIIPPSPRKGSSGEGIEPEPSIVAYSDEDSTQNDDEFKNPDCEIFEEKRWKYSQGGEKFEEGKDVGTQVPEQQSESVKNEENKVESVKNEENKVESVKNEENKVESVKNEENKVVLRNITLETRFERCKRALASFNESKWLTIFNFLLIVIPVATGFMGAEYLSKCPFSSETPVFLIAMIAAGAIVFHTRILLLSQTTLLLPLKKWNALKVAIIVVNLGIIVYIITDVYSFFWTDPSFELELEEYCQEIFYKYTHWTIGACFVVITFLVLLLPNCQSFALQKDKTK